MDPRKRDADNRRRQLRRWIDSHFPNAAAFVRAHNLNQGEISGLLGTKAFGSVKARTLEMQAGMPDRFLEQRDEEGAEAPKPAPSSKWPFPQVDLAAIRALKPQDLARVEGAIIAVLAAIHKEAPAKQPALRVVAQDNGPLAPIGREFPAYPTARPPRQPTSAFDDLIPIPEYPVKMAAGPGHENDDERPHGDVEISRRELERRNINPDKAHAVWATGNSMEPFIPDGSMLLFEERRIERASIRPDAIYALRRNGELLVKKVIRAPLTKRWVARSINQADHPDIDLENDEVELIGRIVWIRGPGAPDEGEWL